MPVEIICEGLQSMHIEMTLGTISLLKSPEIQAASDSVYCFLAVNFYISWHISVPYGWVIMTQNNVVNRLNHLMFKVIKYQMDAKMWYKYFELLQAALELYSLKVF